MTGNALYTRAVEEMIRGIDAAGDHEDSLATNAERSTWVAIKLVRLHDRGSSNAHLKSPRRLYFPILRP